MRSLLMGVSLLALIGADSLCTAGAQARRATALSIHSPATGGAASDSRTGGSREVSRLLRWDRSALTPEARRIIASAADEFRRTGSTRIVATGHTDLSGSPQYNLRLSERRAEAVKAELVRLGVPATVITTIGKGEEDPLVPTKDGVREAQNRRVEIVIPRPPKPAEPPKPVTAAPAPPPPPPPTPKWSASLGPWYGYNLRETDRNDDLTSNLLGAQAAVAYDVSPNVPIRLDLAGYNTIGTSHNDGWGGRATLGADLLGNWGVVDPFIGAYGGYILGSGVQDGVIAGPELGLRFDLAKNLFGYAKAAYDFNFRNEWDQGIPNAGIGAGYRW